MSLMETGGRSRSFYLKPGAVRRPANNWSNEMQSIAAICQQALDIQDACNPRAVARFYVQMTDALAELGIRDTDAICNHPATVLVSHKLADLSRAASLSCHAYYEAYMAAQKIIDEYATPAAAMAEAS